LSAPFERRALRRRCQNDVVTWEWFTRLANDWLPKPRSFILGRTSAVNYPRQELYALIGLVGSVRGALGNGSATAICIM
jgi:hypothetical protein